MGRSVRLRFGERARDEQTHVNLSAVRADTGCLWIAGDETATVERLTADAGEPTQRWSGQLSHDLADYVELPGPRDQEVDVEGLGRSGPYLWVVGSHSLKRKKIKRHHDSAKSVRRLARVESETNRHLLARIPVVPGGDGLPTLARDVDIDGHRRTAAALGGPQGRSLTDELRDDPHLAAFLDIPSKDNGLDVEGIAVFGDRVLLGLRGPVLRGWAVVLELAPYVAEHEPHRLRLGEFDGAGYRTHFLDLAGLGVRDLCPDGPDLLVLAGPTMDLDGPVRLHRWRGAAWLDGQQVVHREDVPAVRELPYGDGVDHAEGITLLGEADDELLVVYDSPAQQRHTESGMVADVFPLP